MLRPRSTVDAKRVGGGISDFDPETLALADHFLLPIVKDRVRHALARHLQREAMEWLVQHEREAADGSIYYVLDNNEVVA